jgi:beta-aspartyl-dipeptidase (metallo-type)
VDATGCIVVPGFIDPHQHLLGGSGEGSLALQTPELFLREIVRAGITSVVGTLGVDTTMKTIAGLLARAKALDEEGVSAWIWTGGYNIPPTTVMRSIREDMLFVDEVVGAGEVAISDERGLNQSAQELAKHVRDTHVGGLLSGKAGVTHVHVGEEETRLEPLRELIEDFRIKREAIDLANAGAHVDFDVVNQDLAEWLEFFIENGGPIDRLTISSDTDSTTPDLYYQQICGLVLRHGYSLDMVLPLITTNPASVLKLQRKGCIEPGKDADIVIIDASSLEIRDVIARGRRMMADGQLVVTEKFLEKSSRNITLIGAKAPGSVPQ